MCASATQGGHNNDQHQCHYNTSANTADFMGWLAFNGKFNTN